MFDVLQNVFGKKKPVEVGTVAEPDGFVIIENNSRTEDSDTESGAVRHTPNALQKNPYAHLLDGVTFPSSPNPSTSDNAAVSNPMTVQDVPFKLNSVLNAATVLEQIWKSVAPCISSISKPSSLDMEYDFSLERSVMAEN